MARQDIIELFFNLPENEKSIVITALSDSSPKGSAVLKLYFPGAQNADIDKLKNFARKV